MGTLSWTLAIGAANGILLSLLVWFTAPRQVSSRLLAILITLLAIRLGPYILGYAGAYDAHPWLTFFPLDFSFAFGPLLWMYVHALTHGKLPASWEVHLAPVGLQALYWVVCFLLPLEAKWQWYTGLHLHVVAPIGAAGGLISAAAYLLASWRAANRYKHWLDRRFANKDEARLGGLRLLLVAFGISLAVTSGFAIVSWVITPLDYFARFPLMIVFALLTYTLGLVGWKHASVEFPFITGDAVQDPPIPVEAQAAPEHPYREQAERWRERFIISGWWREPDLDLAGVAEKLATTPRTLSRTLSEGLGQNFREFIGRIRIEAAAKLLADPAETRSILQLAFEVGFNSKASFNRAFQLYCGKTPTEFRKNAENHGLISRQTTHLAASEAIASTS